jgi:hypothetical protein
MGYRQGHRFSRILGLSARERFQGEQERPTEARQVPAAPPRKVLGILAVQERAAKHVAHVVGQAMKARVGLPLQVLGQGRLDVVVEPNFQGRSTRPPSSFERDARQGRPAQRLRVDQPSPAPQAEPHALADLEGIARIQGGEHPCAGARGQDPPGARGLSRGHRQGARGGRRRSRVEVGAHRSGVRPARNRRSSLQCTERTRSATRCAPTAQDRPRAVGHGSPERNGSAGPGSVPVGTRRAGRRRTRPGRNGTGRNGSALVGPRLALAKGKHRSSALGTPPARSPSLGSTDPRARTAARSAPQAPSRPLAAPPQGTRPHRIRTLGHAERPSRREAPEHGVSMRALPPALPTAPPAPPPHKKKT